MQKILVPTDFSNCSDAALRSAANIAKHTKAELHLLHSLNLSIDWSKVPKDKENDYPETKKQINIARKKIQELASSNHLAGLKTDTFIKYNATHRDVILHADKHKTDMIIMGTHGSSGFNEFFIGTNAQRIVRSANCPVLTVKPEKVIKKLNSVVFVSEFEELDEKALKQLTALFKSFGVLVHLLTIVTPSHFKDTRYALTQMGKYATKMKSLKTTQNIYNAFNVEDGISEFCEESEADALAIIGRSKSDWSKLFSGSLTEGIVNHSSIPVISITPN